MVQVIVQMPILLFFETVDILQFLLVFNYFYSYGSGLQISQTVLVKCFHFNHRTSGIVAQAILSRPPLACQSVTCMNVDIKLIRKLTNAPICGIIRKVTEFSHIFRCKSSKILHWSNTSPLSTSWLGTAFTKLYHGVFYSLCYLKPSFYNCSHLDKIR